MKKRPKVISLFAGVGGICLGFKQAGADVIWANDNDKFAAITYRKNFPETKFIERDISKVSLSEIPKYNILTAGFPCQAFSIAGYRNGFHDERGNLFFQITRILKEKNFRPEAILLENVKNLKSHDKGKTYKVIIDNLHEAGFLIKDKVLNTSEYGNIPQNRERIYIVGFRDLNSYEKFNFPRPTSLLRNIFDLININEKKSDYFYYLPNSNYYEMLFEKMKNEDTVYQIRRTYIRENKSKLCPTLTANMGTGGHNVPIIKDKFGIRKLTPEECYLFQGFPIGDEYQLPKNMARSHLYKQAGNSVSVPVIKRIAEKIINALDV